MMPRAGRLVRSVYVVLGLLAGGCADVRSSKDTTRAAVMTTADTGATLHAVVAAPPRSTAPADDSVIVRARAVLAAARPGFHEWPPSAYAPVLPDSTIRSATTGPLVGDFDGDGVPDVVFDGYDGRIMVTSAVLSNNGHPKVVSVEEGFDVPDPLTPRQVRFVVAPYTFKGKRGVGVGFVSYDASGRAMLPPTNFIYVNGYFAELIEGE